MRKKYATRIGKFENRLYSKLFCIISLFGFSVNPLHAQENKTSNLVNATAIIPNIHIDLRYATSNNFTGQVVYDSQECFLHKHAALKLLEVQIELETMGLSLKIWDGFRPFKAQYKFWELLPDPRYVSDPKEGGRHTRGVAVDVTIVKKNGEELPMPSAFDEFSEKAHRDYMQASQEEIQNRELLSKLMESHGFIGLPTEWWHFDLVEWKDYPPIEDIVFEAES